MFELGVVAIRAIGLRKRGAACSTRTSYYILRKPILQKTLEKEVATNVTQFCSKAF